MKSDILEIMEWDSKFFGKKTRRGAEEIILDKDNETKLLAEIKNEKFETIYYWQGSSLTENLKGLYRLGFELIDIEVILEKRLAKYEKNVDEHLIDLTKIKNSQTLKQLYMLAQKLSQKSRFWRDVKTRFRVEEMYRIWIKRFIGGTDKGWCYGLKINNKVISMAIFQDEGEEKVVLELVAVEDDFRGRGWGRKMMDSSLVKLAADGIGEVAVVTQLSNIIAVKFYLGWGLELKSARYIFHWHRR